MSDGKPDEKAALDAKAAEEAKAAAERSAARKRAARAKKEEARGAATDEEREILALDPKEVRDGVRAWVEESREETRERVEAAAELHGAPAKDAERLARRCRAGFLEVSLLAWGLRFSLARWGARLGGFFPLLVLALGGCIWALKEWRLRAAVRAAEIRWEKLRSRSSSGPAAPGSPISSGT